MHLGHLVQVLARNVELLTRRLELSAVLVQAQERGFKIRYLVQEAVRFGTRDLFSLLLHCLVFGHQDILCHTGDPAKERTPHEPVHVFEASQNTISA